jgi:ATP-dependent Lon protease
MGFLLQEQNKMKLQIKLNEDEHQDIKINDNMVINIHRGDVGYVIDVYNTNDDLVCTNSIWDDDLDTAVEEPDIVTVTCYGQTKEYNRKEAIDFFTEGMLWCDPGSSEYSRYAMIVSQLESGSTHACDTVSEQESKWQGVYDKHSDTVEELIVSAVREDCEKHYNMELTDADWQKIYTKCTDVKRAEALKEAYRELKEELGDDAVDESYLDEVAEAASEQYDKAREWCKQQIEEATDKNKSKIARHSSGLREFLDTITDLDWAEIATRHRERCKRAEESNK